MYSVVIVTYNRLALLQECLSHVERQTVRPEKILVIDNASDDGTREFLASKEREPQYEMIYMEQNAGGAGGFAKGVAWFAAEERKDASEQAVLLIDDDAMLAPDYAEKLLKRRAKHRDCHAFAGSVLAERNGALSVDTFHRRMLKRPGLFAVNCPENAYRSDIFRCDIASFCGLMIDVCLIKEIGVPHGEYFIWHDDLEYCLRIMPHSQILVVPDAELIHKTKNYEYTGSRHYDWREYYAVRNRILYLKEHGTVTDRIVNAADRWLRIYFRNWLFDLIKKDHSDWKYERKLVRQARSDAGIWKR